MSRHQKFKAGKAPTPVTICSTISSICEIIQTHFEPKHHEKKSEI